MFAHRTGTSSGGDRDLPARAQVDLDRRVSGHKAFFLHDVASSAKVWRTPRRIYRKSYQPSSTNVYFAVHKRIIGRPKLGEPVYRPETDPEHTVQKRIDWSTQNVYSIDQTSRKLSLRKITVSEHIAQHPTTSYTQSKTCLSC